MASSNSTSKLNALPHLVAVMDEGDANSRLCGSGDDLFSGLRGRGWAKSDNGAKTCYVYLLTSIILYKNPAYFEGTK